MKKEAKPILPKAPSVAGVESEVIADLAWKLIGERLEQIFEPLFGPRTVKPHTIRRSR